MKSRNPRSIFFKAMAGASTVDDDVCFGFLAGYGNIDDARDRLHKNCCGKSIIERGPNSTTARKIAMLYMHKQEIPVGRFTKLEEKDTGLYYEGKLDMVPFVTSTLKPQLQSKTINNHSIGYNYIWDEGKTVYNEAEDCYDIYELDLFEGSFCTLGMNENTPFGGFKKFLDNTDEIRQLNLDAEKALRGIKSYKRELELRNLIMKYQSLLDSAAEVVLTEKKQKPITQFDYKVLTNLILTK